MRKKWKRQDFIDVVRLSIDALRSSETPMREVTDEQIMFHYKTLSDRNLSAREFMDKTLRIFSVPKGSVRCQRE